MKWSVVVALFAGGVAVIVAFIAVELRTLDQEAEQTGAGMATVEQVETTSQTPDPFDSGGDNEHAQKASTSAAGRQESAPAAQASSDDAAGDRAPSTELPSAAARSPLEATTMAVTGGPGNLTFKRQAPAETDSLPIKATKISVVGENGDVFELSSSSGQPVVVTRNLDDGLYKWEAVHQPELLPRVREELSAARESGDLEAQRRLTRKFRDQGLLPSEEEIAQNRQSGSFRIVNGQMVEKNATEEN